LIQFNTVKVGVFVAVFRAPLQSDITAHGQPLASKPTHHGILQSMHAPYRAVNTAKLVHLNIRHGQLRAADAVQQCFR
jgi:hypothetical protein